jgi:hypothetical protein
MEKLRDQLICEQLTLGTMLEIAVRADAARWRLFIGPLAEPLICNDLALRLRQGRYLFPVISRGKCPHWG